MGKFYDQGLWGIGALALVLSGCKFDVTTVAKLKAAASSGNSSASCSTANGAVAAGSTLNGFQLSGVVFPALCGSKVTRTCLSSGQFDGAVPVFDSCSQQCQQPDTQQAVNVGSAYYSYTKATGATQAECDAAKVTSICNAQSGTFLPAPSAVSKTCLVVGQVCPYTTAATGINSPSGNLMGATASGYASQAATYPQLCGAQATVTCQADGTWTGSTPRYSACVQKCLNPDSNMPMDANSTYTYFTASSGTATTCNAAKVTSTCSQSSGQFVPAVAATRYATCSITAPATGYYVSPGGADSNNGLSPSAPFLTLEKAQAAMQGSSIKTAYLMGGTYTRTATLNLGASDAGEAWLAYPGQTPVLDGGNKVSTAISVAGNQITIRWLTVQNFALMGISTQNVTGVLIDSNTIKNINSNTWNQAGIELLYSFTNGKISHNLVQNVKYGGIDADNAPGDSITGLVIDSNVVSNACISVADCGAIYADDRSHASTGIVINNNVISNYGTTSNQSKAIYLDDQLSNATVKNNIAYGTGSFAFQIHGGDHNVFQNNIFDISGAGGLGFYQYDGPGATNYGMGSNSFTCNIVYSANRPPSSLWTTDIVAGDTLPHVANNLYWDEAGALNTGSIVDLMATVANPGFVNPSQANYSFQAATPTFCNFVPINTSQVGPLPNP